MPLCVCVRVCARVCMHACVCVCVRACIHRFEQDVLASGGRFRVPRMRAVLTHFCASTEPPPAAFLFENGGQQIIARNNCSDYNNGSLRTTARDDSSRTAIWRTDSFSAASFGGGIHTRYFERRVCYQMDDNTRYVEVSYFFRYTYRQFDEVPIPCMLN